MIAVTMSAVLAATALAGVAPAPAPGPAPSPLRIMPLGDSITSGIGSATMSSYRVDLQNRLHRAGLATDFVGSQRDGLPATADLDHEGHVGWTIAQIAAQVPGRLATYRPDAVLLQAGTNDMRTAAGAAGATGRLSALIDRIEAADPGADVFVAEITGTRSANAVAQQKRTDAFNAQVPGIVTGKGPRVHLVDQSTVRGIDIRDGLHPNDVGYRKMAWNWYLALARRYGAGRVWPRDDNPYAATRGYFCHLVDGDPGPRWVAYFDCRWYYRTLVAKIWAWRTRRIVTETRRVRVGGHYVTRTVKVTKWVAFDPDRRTV